MKPSERICRLLVDGHHDSIPLHCLQPEQIAMIDEALSSLGDFGEVRLVVEKGRLRFVVTHRSFDALRWQPGGITADVE
ncbi:MAG: hypothetical protein JW862_15360 [Anaerolineales bacterium]|nr:hypothetical protein [Anaerolineales bacterium]